MNTNELLQGDRAIKPVVMNRLYTDVIYAFKMGKSIEDIAACYDYEPAFIEDIIREYCGNL